MFASQQCYYVKKDMLSVLCCNIITQAAVCLENFTLCKSLFYFPPSKDKQQKQNITEASALVCLILAAALPSLAAFPQGEKLPQNECVSVFQKFHTKYIITLLLCFILEMDLTANFDRVFWLGDFNFRVTLDRSKVDGLLEKYKDQENPECKVSMQHSNGSIDFNLFNGI